MALSPEHWPTTCTTPIFELVLHFGPNYIQMQTFTSAQHLQRRQRCRANEILLTQRKKQTYIQILAKYKIQYSQPLIWRSILYDTCIAHLLPVNVNTHYQLRPKQHDRQLIPKTTKLYGCNFVIRMLYKHSYWLYFIVHSLNVLITFILLLSYIVQVAFWQLDIKRRWWCFQNHFFGLSTHTNRRMRWNYYLSHFRYRGW